MVDWLNNCLNELKHDSNKSRGNDNSIITTKQALMYANTGNNKTGDLYERAEGIVGSLVDGSIVSQEVLWYFAGLFMLNGNRIKYRTSSNKRCSLNGNIKLRGINEDNCMLLKNVLNEVILYNFPENISKSTDTKEIISMSLITEEDKKKNNDKLNSIHGTLIDMSDPSTEGRYRNNNMSYAERLEFIKKRKDSIYLTRILSVNNLKGYNFLKFLGDNGMLYNKDDDSFSIEPKLIPNIKHSLEDDINKGVISHKDMRLYLLAGIIENFIRYGTIVKPRYMRIFFNRNIECQSVADLIEDVIGKKVSMNIYDETKKSYKSSTISLYPKDMKLLHLKLYPYFLGIFFNEAYDELEVTRSITEEPSRELKQINEDRRPLNETLIRELREAREIIKNYERITGINQNDNSFKNTIITDTQTPTTQTPTVPTVEDLKSTFSEDLIRPKSKKAPDKFDSAMLRDIALEINDPEEAPIKSKPPKADEPKLISKDEADVFKKAEEIQKNVIDPSVDWRYAQVPVPTVLKERYFYDYKNVSYNEEELKSVLASDPQRYDRKGIELRGLKHSDILDKSRVYDIQRPKYDEVQFTVNVSKRESILPLVPYQIIDLSRVDKLFAITVEDYVKSLRPKFDNKYLITGDLVELRKMQYQYFYYNNGIWNDDGDVIDKARYDMYEARLKLEMTSLIKDMGFETEKQYDQWKFMYGPEDLMQTISSKYRGYDDKFMLKKLDDRFKEWQKRNLKSG
jgi:hypothetical protein